MSTEVPIIIKENSRCQLGEYELEIITHLGNFADVHYFKVRLHNVDKLGLLRVGSVNGGLKREIELRETLSGYKMFSELLASVTKESVELSSSEPVVETTELEATEISSSEPIVETMTEETIEESDREYLEEELYEEVDFESSAEKLLLLSYLPEEGETLETWFQQDHDLEQILLIVSQICQLFRYAYEREWCFISILPQYCQIGTPIQFFDLTTAYKVDTELAAGFISDYSAPELSYGGIITEEMSTYVVGTVLYQALHQKLPQRCEDRIINEEQKWELEIKKIPRLYQIIRISLNPIPEERFPLGQLVNLLVTTRKSLPTPKVKWEVASGSTVGLSLKRLQNEDNYGIRQNYDSFILAVVADGMGGMDQGEIASKLAVETFMDAHIPPDITTPENRADWLISLIERANERVSAEVRNGGTTLSIVLAVGRELNIAHVGDSRIFLARKNILCQLSEDHSMVAMLLASGAIEYEESLNHPQRNIILKSIGSKPKLSHGYVQDLSKFGEDLSLTLEDGDTLILCSDGVWDLIPVHELPEVFESSPHLQGAVDNIIERVLERGANDNATIIALKCGVRAI